MKNPVTLDLEKSSAAAGSRPAAQAAQAGSDELDYSVHYRKWHDGSIEECRERSRFYRMFLDKPLRGFPRSASVLDYGCGFGLLTYYLASRFDTVLGVDASVQQTRVARSNHLPVEHLPLAAFEAWCEGSAERFDLIFLMDVLEHVPEDHQIAFLRRLASVLKPGGSMFIQTPNANSPLAMRWRHIDWTHRSSFTEHSLEFVCHHAGLGNFTYLPDDSSVTPRLPFIPRPGLARYALKKVFRALWRFYAWCEFGAPALKMPMGVNLFVRADKLESTR